MSAKTDGVNTPPEPTGDAHSIIDLQYKTSLAASSITKDYILHASPASARGDKTKSLPSGLTCENWSRADRLIPSLEDYLRVTGDADTDFVGTSDALLSLKNFGQRILCDHDRFRHPSCQPVHALLTMGGYRHAKRMSLCMVQNKFTGLFCPCSRRRYCAYCSRRCGQQAVSRFAHAFNEDTYGFTFSWRFRDDVGLPFSQFSDYRFAQRLWDIAKTCLRTLGASKSNLSQGAFVAEQLAVTRFLPLRVNPHLHGLIRCAFDALDGFRNDVETAIGTVYPALGNMGVYPVLTFHPLANDAACARWLNYSFAAFGLGEPSRCLDARYEEAYDRCGNTDDRRNLNLEVVSLVDGFDEMITAVKRCERTGRESHVGRWRSLRTGCFHHMCRGFIGADATAEHSQYLEELAIRVHEEDRAKKQADGL